MLINIKHDCDSYLNTLYQARNISTCLVPNY